MSNKIYIGDSEITTGGSGSGENMTRVIAAVGKSDVESQTDDKYDHCSELGLYPSNLIYDAGGDPTVTLHIGCGEGENSRKDSFRTYSDGEVRFLDTNDGHMKPLSDLQHKADRLEVSVNALDASALAFDASIKALAQGGGSGGSFDPTEINSSISDISTRVHNIESNYLVADDISIYYTKSQINASFGDVDYALNNISDDIEHLDTNKADKTEVYTRNWIDTSINSLNTRIVDVSSYAQDVSARMPIFEYNSATQTLNIIA